VILIAFGIGAIGLSINGYRTVNDSLKAENIGENATNGMNPTKIAEDAKAAGLPDTINLRIIDAQVDVGILYPVFIYLVVAGTTSAVNLTDGLDGLAAGCAAIVLLAYIAITFTTRQTDLALVAGCLGGGGCGC